MNGSPQQLMILVTAVIIGILAGLLLSLIWVKLRHRPTDTAELMEQNLAEAYLSTVRTLVVAIDSKDSYTRSHSSRVQEIAASIARQMGLPAAEIEAIQTAALVHDIGKIGIPEHILKKPGRLSPEEYAVLKEHPIIGSQMLEPVSFPWPIAKMVRSHHERWDGAGYPDRMHGKDIPQGARVLAVADAFDAMISERSYHNRMTINDAVENIINLSGSQFDPSVVNALKDVTKKRVESATPVADEGTGTVTEMNKEQEKPVSSASRGLLLSQSDMTQIMDSKLGPRNTISLVTDKVRNAFRADCCVIFLKEDVNSSKLVCCGASGINSGYFNGASTQVSEGMTGAVVSTGRSKFGPYDKSDVMLTAGIDDWVEFGSCAIAAVARGGNIIGCVNIYSCASDTFNQEHTAVLAQIGSQISAVLERAWMQLRAEQNTGVNAMTGLLSLNTLQDSVGRAFAEGRQVTVFSINLDGLNSIGEVLGLPSKEQFVQAAGRLIRSSLACENLIARSTNDTFIAAAVGIEGDEAKKIAQHMEQQFRVYCGSGRFPEDCRPEMKIRTSSSPQDGGSSESLFAVVDANRNGRRHS